MSEYFQECLCSRGLFHHHQQWPEWDSVLVVDEVVSVAVQVNGKLRAVLDMPANANQDEVETNAVKNHQVRKFTEGKKVVRMIYIPGKVLNIVVK